MLKLLAEPGLLCPAWRLAFDKTNKDPLFVFWCAIYKLFGAFPLPFTAACGTDIMYPPGCRYSVILPRLPAYAHHNRRSACRRAPQMETSLPKSPLTRS